MQKHVERADAGILANGVNSYIAALIAETMIAIAGIVFYVQVPTMDLTPRHET